MEHTARHAIGTAALPLQAQEQSARLTWKLKGTGKKIRRQVIESCTEGQPVFVICNSDGSNCTIITENGEEIGRLSDSASAEYHHMVEKKPHNIYIKRISMDLDKPRVKVLVLVHGDRRIL